MVRGALKRAAAPLTPRASRDGGAMPAVGAPPDASVRPTGADLRERVVVESVRPEVDGGRFPAKAVVGQRFVVEADIFAEYEPIVSSVLRYRRDGEAGWRETPMQPAGEDH